MRNTVHALYVHTTYFKERMQMPSMKKTGVAYVVCGLLIILAVLFAKLAGLKLIAGLAAGVVLTLVGLLLTKKKK